MMETIPYQYSPSQCDVEDQAKLEVFREKRRGWLNLLEHDKEHSVTGQLTALLWQDATFRLLNEMRKGAPGGRPATITSPLLAEALDSGYVTNMILGIGRLVDRGSDVVSLRRAFEDVRASRALITREIYVCFDGMKYDSSTVLPIWERARPGEMIRTPIGGPLDGSTPRRLHSFFDKLSGVEPDNRRRTDTIADETFVEIDKMLSDPAIDSVLKRRHKFVAHAADHRSRAKAPLARYSLTMTDVEAALRPILRATERLLGDILLGTASGFMATAQFNILEGLGGSLVDDQLMELHEIWDRLSQERNDWHK